ncbi:glycosyltransferase family 4 protein [Halopseudomonas oceani]|uniref:glycosyltransferase family 4 protein n=1 Tax=Halopseudomonas oceani TaxID=1708783 RepID=UPI002AA6FBC8|nr:glycosyltransferase family 4 protein [Halopseudomonas oceani]
MKIELVMMSSLNKSGGGRETWLLNYLEELQARECADTYDFSVLQLAENSLLDDFGCGGGGLVGAIRQYGKLFSVFPTPIRFAVSYLTRGMCLSIKEPLAYDVVIAVGGLNEAIPVAFSSFLFRGRSRSKKIIWLRTIYTKEKGYRFGPFARRMLLKLECFLYKRFFNLVVANGDDTAAFYRQAGLDVSVVHNSTNLSRWLSVDGSESERFRIAFIGRLSSVKGISEFLSSIRRMQEINVDEFANVEFHVVGDGDVKSKEAVLDLQDKGLLKYHGAMDNRSLPNFLEDIDCCVALTLLNDDIGGGGVSNALIEQMAAGKAIIAWDNSIFTPILSPEVAWMVPQGSVGGLTSAYIDACSDRAQVFRKGRLCRERSLDFDIRAHVNRFYNLINKGA